MAQTHETDQKTEAPQTALSSSAPLTLAERRRLMQTETPPEAPRPIFHDWAMI